MSNRFPIEFFQELTKKQFARDHIDDADTTLVDGDETEEMSALEDTIPERVATLKFFQNTFIFTFTEQRNCVRIIVWKITNIFMKQNTRVKDLEFNLWKGN